MFCVAKICIREACMHPINTTEGCACFFVIFVRKSHSFSSVYESGVEHLSKAPLKSGGRKPSV
jgi:hypothetical protein